MQSTSFEDVSRISLLSPTNRIGVGRKSKMDGIAIAEKSMKNVMFKSGENAWLIRKYHCPVRRGNNPRHSHIQYVQETYEIPQKNEILR